MTDKPKGAPPVTPKSKRIDRLDKGQRAETGGDWYDRFRGNYSKTPQPQSDESSDFYPMGFGK